MDANGDTQPTQQATQNVLDPRRLGKQNSGFSDEDICDIICLLLPYSDNARREVARIALESSQHLVGREDAENVDIDYSIEDIADRFSAQSVGEHAIALRLSSNVKSPTQGFTFGRNSARCDICFVNDPYRRLSNIHFRIFLNEYGVLMLEDHSTNGTVVDDILLKSRAKNPGPTKRTLNSGSKVSILMHKDSSDLQFLVRIPRREGEYEQIYRQNWLDYMRNLETLTADDQQQTISAGPAGHVDLFRPAPGQHGATGTRPVQFQLPHDTTQENSERLTKEWNGNDNYNRVGQIGKGAFATVHKVTSKFDGKPYAAKELDKRRFMKNGVLDQKVENEMRIMQNVQHPNIVRYIEHFEYDNRLFIIVMELVPGGDLGNLINNHGALPEVVVQVMAKQLLDALGYLHQKNITHRDVKPDNILIQSQQPFTVKLTDFGLSKMVDNEQTFLRTFCGTLLYCAPEVYSEYADYDEYGKRNPRNKHRRAAMGQRYDHAVDVWSLAGVLFYALTGSPPYPVRTGISYSELLHQIMTKPLDISPLVKAGVSGNGIDFLQHMLQRRPENRATVQDLKEHPWMGGSGTRRTGNDTSPDMISGEELDASQLSLTDHQIGQDAVSDDEILDEGMDGDSFFGGNDKENHTFGHTNPPRLFGEVGVSAVGSSGAIPAYLLNLPISDSSLGETEIRDSYGSELSSTPRKPKSQPKSQQLSSGGAPLSPEQSHSVEELTNKTFNESQSLGDAESNFGNMNLKSLAGSNLQQSQSALNNSKRKTSFGTSDEMEGKARRWAPNGKPSFKRLKSESNLESASDSDEGENSLYALVPPISRVQSGRQIDRPVHKSTFWTAGDHTSMHLRYPEMTQLQYDAFESAAKGRGEEFRPGKSILWEFAMRNFPPADVAADFHHYLESQSDEAPWDEVSPRLASKADLELPATAGPHDPGAVLDTLPPEAQGNVPHFLDVPRKRHVALLQSTSDSVVTGISVSVTESVTSWGRGVENTRTYVYRNESRVPKFAFKLLLWKDSFDPSKDLRPWNRPSVTEEGLYHFYISTKATNGIVLAGTRINSSEPKIPTSASRNWARVYDGDVIIIWHSPDYKSQTQLVFRCNWGGSAVPRPQHTEAELPPPVLVPDAIARRLDEACLKTEKRLAQQTEQQLKMSEANQDQVEREKHIEREKLRSLTFERKRLEATRWISARNSRRGSGSPASAPGGLATHEEAGGAHLPTSTPSASDPA